MASIRRLPGSSLPVSPSDGRTAATIRLQQQDDTLLNAFAGKIIAFRNDRLGARINVILNAIRVAGDYDAAFAVVWPSHDNVSPELQNPQELFSAEFMADHFLDDVNITELQHTTVQLSDLTAADTAETLRARLVKGQGFMAYDALNLVCLPWEDRASIAARLPAMMDRLGLQPKVRAAMAQIDAALADATLCAYHLRRGDIIQMDSRASQTLWPSKYVPRVFYEQHIRQRLAGDPRVKIVVFSDEPREIAAFCRMDPRIVGFDDLVGQMELSVIQRDFLEIYAMSRCSTVTAPSASAFSRVAVTIGNGTLQPLLNDLSDEARTAALKDLSERLEKTPEVFAGPADLGQNFPFLCNYHRRQGTPEIAQRILRQHLDQGFDRAYIYDQLAELMFFNRDWAGMQHVVAVLRQRPVYMEEANSLTYALAAMAALEAGDLPAAREFAQITNWLTPVHPLTRLLTGLLYCYELFDPALVHPVDPALFQARPIFVGYARQASMRLVPVATKLAGKEMPENMMIWLPFEMHIRDWQRLNGTKMPPAFSNQAKLARIVEFYRSAYRKRTEEPSVRAGLASLLRQSGRLDEAGAELEAAMDADPENPLFLKRLADLFLAWNEPVQALKVLEQASELSGGHLCYRAELGLTLYELGRGDQASAIFEQIADTDHRLIEVMLLSADILRRRPRTRQRALEIAQRASSLAHGSTRLIRLQAKIHDQLGQTAEAEAVLDQLKQWRRGGGRFASRVKRPSKS